MCALLNFLHRFLLKPKDIDAAIHKNNKKNNCDILENLFECSHNNNSLIIIFADLLIE